MPGWTIDTQRGDWIAHVVVVLSSPPQASGREEKKMQTNVQGGTERQERKKKNADMCGIHLLHRSLSIQMHRALVA